MEISLLGILASYLWGGIPSAYLLGKYLKDIDVRHHGSGNVGASNVMKLFGNWTGLCLGAFDCLIKGTLPIVTLNFMNESLLVQSAAGLATITGHNWSPYINFTGGRGVATTIGVLIGLLMWKETLIVLAVIGIMGRLVSNDAGPWTLVAALLIPMLAYFFSEPPELVYVSVAITILLVLKRLTANWEKPQNGHRIQHVLAYRAVWDRDVLHKECWTDRNPPVAEK